MRTEKQIKGGMITRTGFGAYVQCTQAGVTIKGSAERRLAETAIWLLLGAAAILHQVQIL
tara:strand:+ start:1347 stop:1526 length:180 start_codon:yes stop_codon:yes gene_type:complete